MPIRNNFFTGSKTKNPWANIMFGEAQEPEPPMIRRALPQEYDFSNPSLDEYSAHIHNMPQEADYGPSKWRRLGAGLIGAATGLSSRNPIAAYQAAENINRTPYRRAIDAWDVQGQGLETAARLENSGITQRRLYQGMENTAAYRSEGNDIKRIDAATRQFAADTAAKRLEFTNAIAATKDEREKERLAAQKVRWEQQNSIAERRLNIERDRAGAYTRSVDLQSDRMNKGDTDTQLAARRRMAIDRVNNENPDWFDRNGNPLPEHSQKVEEQIQRYMSSRRYGNVNLPSFSSGADDSDWVVSPR